MNDRSANGVTLAPEKEALVVYFDRSCALCRTEMTALDLPAAQCELRDCSAAAFADPAAQAAGVTREDLLRVLHVRDAQGRWYRGIDALIQVYRLAGRGRIAAVLSRPLLRPMWDRVYIIFARHRQRLSGLGLHRLLGAFAQDLIRVPTGMAGGDGLNLSKTLMRLTMKTILTRTIALLALSLCTGATAFADTAWDESVDGDLSSDPGAPTFLTLSGGSHTVWGSVANPADTRDYMSFTIGSGQRLAAINLLGLIGVGTGGGDGVAFNAINSGGTSLVPGVDTIGSFLGGAHVDATMPSGTNLLFLLAGAPQGGTGFGAPLGPGTYTYMIQQTGPTMIGYGLDFVVVPLPAAVWLFGSALLSFFGMRRARR